MKSTRAIVFWTCLVAAGVLWSATIVWAQTSADYDVTWHVIGGGGPAANSEEYRIEWTMGQPIVGAVSSEELAEEGGFWAGIVSTATPTEPAPTPAPTNTQPAPTATATPETPELFMPILTK